MYDRATRSTWSRNIKFSLSFLLLLLLTVEPSGQRPHKKNNTDVNVKHWARAGGYKKDFFNSPLAHVRRRPPPPGKNRKNYTEVSVEERLVRLRRTNINRVIFVKTHKTAGLSAKINEY